jgi:hypothetical protein
MDLKLSENIYKSHTLRPQTDNFGNDLYYTAHKKNFSFDSQNYQKRIRIAILNVLKTNQEGIFMDALLKKLYFMNGCQVRTELLGVNNFKDFLIFQMGEDCNIQLVKPHYPQGEYR